MKFVIKVAFAVAAAVGAVYLLATKGEAIVAWAKEMLDKITDCKCCSVCTCEEKQSCCTAAEPDTDSDAISEEAPAEEAAPEAEEAPETASVAEQDVVAAPEDFAE